MGINLLDLFSVASGALNKSKNQLNQADDYNHDHGTNMVQIFNTITQAIGQKQNDTPSNQMQYASQVLKQQTSSGSATLYSQALQTASQQFKGQDINEGNVVSLIQTLLAGGQKPQPAVHPEPGGDLLGTLLGGLTSGSQQQAQSSGGNDLLGSLLGSLTGSQQQQSGGSDLLGSLLGGGQQQGGGVLGSLLGSMLGGGQQSGSGGVLGSLLGSLVSGGGAASLLSGFVAKSPLGESPTRAASGMIVAQSLLQGAGNLLGKKPVVAKKTTSTAKKSTAAKKPAAKKPAAKKPAPKKR